MANTLEAARHVDAASKSATVLYITQAALVYVILTMDTLKTSCGTIALICTHFINTLARIQARIGGTFVDFLFT